MFKTNLLAKIIEKISADISVNASEITELDQAIGDGDHITNLQRGLEALFQQRGSFKALEWSEAWKQIGMTVMSKVGGASGSLFATLFLEMSKNAEMDFSKTYAIGIEAMKRRGKSDIGEKTMLDVLIPVCDYLQVAQSKNLALAETLTGIKNIAIRGMESTREMQATKGRSAFLEARSIGVIDAGAKSCQVIICAIADVLLQELPA